MTGKQALSSIGNAGDNLLLGNAAANILKGLAGNDTLNGGAGRDRLEGGRGDDTYVIDSRADVMVEKASEGSDTVRVGFNFQLGLNFENLSLTGSANVDGTGNESDNVLRGNSGNNTLSGGGGNDTLHSGRGFDVLLGGAGIDTFVLNEFGAKIDHIGDFVSGTDRLLLAPGIPVGGGPGNINFRLSTKLSDGNDFLVFDEAASTLFYDAAGNGVTLAALVTFEPGTVILAGDILNWTPIV